MRARSCTGGVGFFGIDPSVATDSSKGPGIESRSSLKLKGWKYFVVDYNLMSLDGV